MKFFTNKSIWSKIVIVLIFIILFQFIVIRSVHAEETAVLNDDWGGKLIKPIVSLVVSLADAIYGIIQKSIMGIDSSLIPIDMQDNLWETILKIVLVVVTIIVAIAVIVRNSSVEVW